MIVAARLLAGLAGVALLLVALWGALWVMLAVGISAQAPDPFVIDGDPCCGHPDTWGEVTEGAAWSLGLALIDALLAAVAVALVGWAAGRRRPRAKRLALLPGVALVATGLVLAGLVVPRLDEAVTATRCGSPQFSRAALRSGEAHERRTMAWAVARCDLVQGRTRAQVGRLLGAPRTRARIDRRTTYWGLRHAGGVLHGRSRHRGAGGRVARAGRGRLHRPAADHPVTCGQRRSRAAGR